jgi:large subunit ribosomal protein L29
MARDKVVTRDMTVGEVEQRIADIKKELFNLKFRNSMRQLDNPLQIRYLRRDLARLETALTEHRKGIQPLLGDSLDAPAAEAGGKERS